MSSWMAGVCETNGINIHHLRTGGSGPSVVLLHGLMLSGACWTPFARALEDEFDVLMPDARGHGRSSAPDHGYRYTDLAGDVIGLIRRLGLASPILLGHSMGGMTAAVVAAQNKELIRGLVLVDPTFLEPERQHEVAKSDVAEQHRRLLDRPRDEVMAELRARNPGRPAELRAIFADARLQTCMSAFDVLTPPNPDYRELVRAIDVPTLLVYGGDSPVILPEMAREIRGLNPHIHIEQIEDVGHAVPFEQPERFEAVVKPFLRTLAQA